MRCVGAPQVAKAGARLQRSEDKEVKGFGGRTSGDKWIRWVAALSHFLASVLSGVVAPWN